MKKALKDMGSFEDFVECCKLYDKQENGTMMLGELEHILLNLGEKLEREEVDMLINAVTKKMLMDSFHTNHSSKEFAVDHIQRCMKTGKTKMYVTQKEEQTFPIISKNISFDVVLNH